MRGNFKKDYTMIMTNRMLAIVLTMNAVFLHSEMIFAYSRSSASGSFSASADVELGGNYSVATEACANINDDSERQASCYQGVAYAAAGVDCISCFEFERKKTGWDHTKDILGTIALPAAIIGSAYLGYKGVKANANAAVNIASQCTIQQQNFYNQNLQSGGNNLTSMPACQGVGADYAGYAGLSASLGGSLGNPMIAGGYSPGFSNLMLGPNMAANGYMQGGANYGLGLGGALGLGLLGLLGGAQGSISLGGQLPSFNASVNGNMPNFYAQGNIPGVSLNGNLQLPIPSFQGQFSVGPGGAYPGGMNGEMYPGNWGIGGNANGQVMCFVAPCPGQGGFNVNGQIALPGFNGQIAVPGFNGQIAVPGFNGQIAVGPGGGGGGAAGSIMLPDGRIVLPGGSLGIDGSMNMPGTFVGPDGRVYVNGGAGAQGNMHFPNPNLQGNAHWGPGGLNANLGLSNALYPQNGDYFNATGGFQGGPAYGAGGMGNDYHAQMQARAQAQAQAQGIYQGSYQRSMGNAQTAQMGHQALYQNHMNASRDYYGAASIYGAGAMSGGAAYSAGNLSGNFSANLGSINASIGMGGGASAGFNFN